MNLSNFTVTLLKLKVRNYIWGNEHKDYRFTNKSSIKWNV